MNQPGIGPDDQRHGRGGKPAARAQLGTVIDELSDYQAERALTILEASAEWILTGVSKPRPGETSSIDTSDSAHARLQPRPDLH